MGLKWCFLVFWSFGEGVLQSNHYGIEIKQKQSRPKHQLRLQSNHYGIEIYWTHNLPDLLPYSCNRTIMGLKYNKKSCRGGSTGLQSNHYGIEITIRFMWNLLEEQRCNRTIMGLKLSLLINKLSATFCVAIEPLWDWNQTLSSCSFAVLSCCNRTIMGLK